MKPLLTSVLSVILVLSASADFPVKNGKFRGTAYTYGTDPKFEFRDGSELIIKEGATLTIEDGATVTGLTSDWDGGTVTDASSFLESVTFGKANIFPANAMGALEVDVAEPNNTKTISADSTLTFSATPTTGTVFGLTLTNSDSSAHTITIPSSYSYSLGALRTTFSIPASSSVKIQWEREASRYGMFGDPVKITDLTDATPVGADSIQFHDATDGLNKDALLSTLPRYDVWMVAISDESTAITTGNAKVTFRAPYAATVTAVRASLNTASSSGTPAFDINESNTTIFSTTLTVDQDELTSTTAATPAVISDTAIADDAEIKIDIDTAGTGAKGAKVYIYVTH